MGYPFNNSQKLGYLAIPAIPTYKKSIDLQAENTRPSSQIVSLANMTVSLKFKPVAIWDFSVFGVRIF